MFSYKFNRIFHSPGTSVFCAGAASLMLVGCGGNPENTSVAGTPAEAGSSVEASADPNDAPSPTGELAAVGEKTKRRRDEVWVDANGQKWFGNVPMDAFFDNPYEVASDQTPIGGAAGTMVAGSSDTNSPPATEPAGEPMAVASKDPAMTDASSGEAEANTGTGKPPADKDSWSSLIDVATLDDEVKTARNFLNENVHSVGTFNSSMLMIPPKAAAIGALASIAMEHPEAVSWKDDAKYIRDLAKKMNESTLQRGAKDQKRIEELYDAMSDTLNRSKPAGLDEPPESDSFAEIAEMRLLMMRMEDAEKKMKTEAGNESALGSKKDMVAHEASVLAVMAKIVSMPGYGYGDDPKFVGYATDIVNASRDIKEAAASGDFATYEGLLTKISTTCSNCHSDYKND